MARGWSTDQVSGALIVLFGGWFLAQALALREGPGYAAVGPRVFPVIVGIGFLGSGLALLLGRFVFQRGQDQTHSEVLQSESTDWRTLLMVAGLLALYLALFQPLGFLLASAAFLVACARALGSAAWPRDAAVAIGLSLTAYLLFTRLLGLELPVGPLEPLARLLAGTSGTA